MGNKKEFPQVLLILYRGARAAVGAGIAYAVVVQPDWSDSQSAYKALLLAFVTGFSVSFGKFLRDKLDEWFGYDEKSLIAKTMII